MLGRTLETTTAEIGKTPHPHPTMSEAIMEAALAAEGEAIHFYDCIRWRRAAHSRLRGWGRVDYESALALQDALVAARRDELIGDTLLLLEHPHVFTLGRGADARYLLEARPGVPVFRVSRGGQVTYHGPGQLVGYPILKLEGRDRDIHVYLRRLEHTMIDALAKLGIDAARRDGLTGVWVGERKIGVDRRRAPALDNAAWLRAQRVHRSRVLRRDSAVRNRGSRDDLGQTRT